MDNIINIQTLGLCLPVKDELTGPLAMGHLVRECKPETS